MKRITRSVIRPINTLSLLASSLGVLPLLTRAQDLPSNVGIEIVFPRDDTYQPVDPFPVVFAFSGASAAWTYGFDFTWLVRRNEGCEGQCGVVYSGSFGIEEGAFGSVSFGEDDAYYLVTSALGMGPSVGYTGGYDLEWEFGFSRNCSMSDTGELQSSGGVTSASGTAKFTIQSGANPDVQAQLADNCPLSGGVVGIQQNLDGCPELGASNAAAVNPCDLDVPEDVVNFVVRNLAATGSASPPAQTTTTAASSSVAAPTTSSSSSTFEASSTTTSEGQTSAPSTSSATAPGESLTLTTTTASGEPTSPVGYGPTSMINGTASATSNGTSSAPSPTSTMPTVSNAAAFATLGFGSSLSCLLLLAWGLWLV